MRIAPSEEQKEREAAGKPRYLLKRRIKYCHPYNSLLVSLSLSFCLSFSVSVSGIKATLLRLSSRSFDPSLSGPQGPQTALLSAQLLEPFTEEDNNAINCNALQSKRKRERKRSIEASSVAIIVQL